MISATKPKNETQRLSAVKNLKLLDTPIEERFERITRLLCSSLQVPMAAFTLIDKERQWFKSAQGINVSETPRELAFCAHAILEEDIMMVPDARKDQRFCDNPLVTGEMGINFYAGWPVHSPDGSKVGTLCAIDTKPRELSNEVLQVLRDLSAMLETELKALALSKVQTELLEELEETQRASLVDPLSRIWNRTGIFNFMKRCWSEAIRKKDKIAIVMADIDHFKIANDTHGHPVGDLVIQSVARKLMTGLRTEDAVGRIGGEEFMMVLVGSHTHAIRQTVDRIRSSIASTPIEIDNGKIFVTMSFGAMPCSSDASIQLDTLIKLADEALYKAKKSGRNRVEIASVENSAKSIPAKAS